MTNPPDRSEIRCSHEDRDTVSEILRVAAGDGRLSPEDLDHRLDAAYAATTYGDLDALVRDLPLTRERSDQASLAGADLRLSATLSDRKQSGYWVVPRKIVATASMGTVKLDFTNARCDHAVVDIEVNTWLGDVKVTVPPGWAVQTTDVSALLGSVNNRLNTPAAPGNPLLRITGKVRLSSLTVRPPRQLPFLPR